MPRDVLPFPHADAPHPADADDDRAAGADNLPDEQHHKPSVHRLVVRPVMVQSTMPLRLAEQFLIGQPPIARYAGLWYQRIPGSTVYTTITEERLGTAVYSFLDRCIVEEETKDGIQRRPVEANRHRVGEVLAALVALVPAVDGDPPVSLTGSLRFDPREVVVTPTGLLDLRTHEVRAVGPDFFATAGTSVSYDPSASSPQWAAFLQTLWPDDSAAIEALQEWFGYVLTADTRQQKMLALIGPRRGGKGTIVRVLDALLGRINVAHPTLGDFERPFGLAPLVGRSLAIISDARLSGRADQAAIVERLLGISGEDAQTIDRKHRDPVMVRLSTRIMLVSNEAPRLTDSSSALASRFIVLELTRSFLGHEDHQLEDRLLGELPGIFAWSVQGWDRLRARGYFLQPESGKRIAEEIETLGSPHRAFAEECLEFATGLETPVYVVYARWRSWCEENGIREPKSLQVFGRDFRTAFPDVRDAQRGSQERRRWYIGIGVRP